MQVDWSSKCELPLFPGPKGWSYRNKYDKIIELQSRVWDSRDTRSTNPIAEGKVWISFFFLLFLGQDSTQLLVKVKFSIPEYCPLMKIWTAWPVDCTLRVGFCPRRNDSDGWMLTLKWKQNSKFKRNIWILMKAKTQNSIMGEEICTLDIYLCLV